VDEFLETDQAGQVVTANVAVDAQQLAAIARHLARAHGWRRPPPSRVTLAHVVRHLPRVRAALQGLGFEGGALPRRRPRRLYQSTWADLLAASEECGIPAANLLRACTRVELEASGIAPMAPGDHESS
jgi:hypothetical protein